MSASQAARNLICVFLSFFPIGQSLAQEKGSLETAFKPSAASELLEIALETTAREHERNGPRPTIGSRMLAIVVTAMHDSWAAFDEKAVGTRLGTGFRRPASERDRDK